MTILSVVGLAKRFAGNAVLRGIDLSVEKGERIAILGASGSGKSTLLRCLNFMEMPDAGTVTLDGQVVGPGGKYRESELIAVRQRVGMVFQQFNLFPHMTALGNVMEGLVTVRRQGRAQAQDRAEKELARVGLADKAATYPAHLSGGQKQRVAIARALAMDPLVLVLDEPTSALDPIMSQDVARLLRKLLSERVTMVCVTHDLSLAEGVCNRVVYLEKGIVRAEDEIAQLSDHHPDPHIRAFFGRKRSAEQ